VRTSDLELHTTNPIVYNVQLCMRCSRGSNTIVLPTHLRSARSSQCCGREQVTDVRVCRDCDARLGQCRCPFVRPNFRRGPSSPQPLGSNCDMSAQTGHVRFTADYGSEACQGVGWRKLCALVNNWLASAKALPGAAPVVDAKEPNTSPSVLVRRVIENIRRYQT
jgi:hypothetical protein